MPSQLQQRGEGGRCAFHLRRRFVFGSSVRAVSGDNGGRRASHHFHRTPL
ncbi:hypothetical protein XCCB100_4501 [Xanthomonas campestris pv. campestris]|uniref:Uncharacterized protein n=1 Tax=Xanthomonas campestris pv. campestris (strain B100) TaxID=509169 RepID=A0A1X7QF18_XANCB|nr:hypothetical protein XCCB100_4501 [Xanthomonas campestris pv. campestris]